MSLLAEFEATSAGLLLGPTLEALPSLTVDLERQYALDPDRPIVFCWARYPDRQRLEQVLSDDETVDDFDRVTTANDWTLYRIQRSDSGVVQAYRRWVAVGGELLAGRGSDGRWEVEMRFPDHEAFSAYHDYLESEDVGFELYRLAPEDGTDTDRSLGPVTRSQREALVLAHEHGFFEVPRETSLETIADALEISTQAVSERLRRGQARLIEEHVL